MFVVTNVSLVVWLKYRGISIHLDYLARYMLYKMIVTFVKKGITTVKNIVKCHIIMHIEKIDK